MFKTVFPALTGIILSGCTSSVVMVRSDEIKSQPEMQITTGGDFHTSFVQGTFDIDGQYQGTFHRDGR